MAARPVGSGRWVRPAGEWQTGNVPARAEPAAQHSLWVV